MSNYRIDVSVTVMDAKDGWTRVGWHETHDVEVPKLSGLAPLLARIEQAADEFKATITEGKA